MLPSVTLAGCVEPDFALDALKQIARDQYASKERRKIADDKLRLGSPNDYKRYVELFVFSKQCVAEKTSCPKFLEEQNKYGIRKEMSEIFERNKEIIPIEDWMILNKEIELEIQHGECFRRRTYG